MEALTDTTARQNLAETMSKICNDHAPAIITRKSSESVLMISLEDDQALEETAYLLRSPKNARRLIQAVNELEDGKGEEWSLEE